MGILLSSCAPNFIHSKISFLAENFKDIESATVSSSSWVAKMNTNYDDVIYFNNTLEDHWRSKKIDEISVRSNDNISHGSIQPKNMPRYEFPSLQTEMFARETQAENPTNLSVVLMHSTVLEGSIDKIYLPLGTVLNVLYEEDNWLYVQTADGRVGLVDNKVCIPLEIFSLPSIKDTKVSSSSNRKNFNVISSDRIINTPNFNNSHIKCTEKNFDLLYLRLTRNSVHSKKCDKCTVKALSQKNNEEQKTVILVIRTDYVSRAKDTLSVKKGDIVFLIHCCVRGWFWVKNKHNMEGFIPAVTAGYWCV